MKRHILLMIGTVIIALLAGCGKDKGAGGSKAMSYVPESATAVVTIDVGRILSDPSVQEFLEEPLAEMSREMAQKMDSSLLSPYDIGQVVIFTTEDLALMGIAGPQRLTIAVSFAKEVPLDIVDSLAGFPMDKRAASGGQPYLANDAQQLYMCAPEDNIWLVSPNEAVIAHLATGEKPEADEMSKESAAPALMKEMAADEGLMAALSFDISESERPDLGPMAEMLAQDTSNPELAQVAEFAPVLQQAISTINSAGFSLGRKDDQFVLATQMRFADQETAEEIRQALIMMLSFAGGEVTRRELGFAKDIIDRVDITTSQQTVSVSVTVSDSDIEEAQRAMAELDEI
ncbi:MAG: hypothetical protein ACFFEM_15775 [Candidatus Thorarchaeota archaeon]